MKASAILWTAGDRPMCLIDTRDQNCIALEGQLEMLQRLFPESGARMAQVIVLEDSDTPSRFTEESSDLDTIRPPAPDPFAPESIDQVGRSARLEMPTVDEEAG